MSGGPAERPRSGGAGSSAAGDVPAAPPPGLALPAADGTELARATVGRARAAGAGHGAGRRGQRPGSAAPPAAPAVRGQTWSGSTADRRDPQPLSAAVDGLVGMQGWAEDLAVRGVLARWDLIVGADVAAHCTVERFVDGRLTVRADSTAWATQVRLLGAHVLRRLAEEAGDGVVTELAVLGPAAPSWVRGPRRVQGRGPRDTYG